MRAGNRRSSAPSTPRSSWPVTRPRASIIAEIAGIRRPNQRKPLLDRAQPRLRKVLWAPPRPEPRVVGDQDDQPRTARHGPDLARKDALVADQRQRRAKPRYPTRPGPVPGVYTAAIARRETGDAEPARQLHRTACIPRTVRGALVVEVNDGAGPVRRHDERVVKAAALGGAGYRVTPAPAPRRPRYDAGHPHRRAGPLAPPFPARSSHREAVLPGSLRQSQLALKKTGHVGLPLYPAACIRAARSARASIRHLGEAARVEAQPQNQPGARAIPGSRPNAQAATRLRPPAASVRNVSPWGRPCGRKLGDWRVNPDMADSAQGNPVRTWPGPFPQASEAHQRHEPRRCAETTARTAATPQNSASPPAMKNSAKGAIQPWRGDVHQERARRSSAA